MSNMVDYTAEKFSDRGNERMVLSCVLRDPNKILDVSTKVKAEDFLSLPHQHLFSVLSSLYERGVTSFDLMAVVNEIDAKGVSSLVGGPEYVDALISNPVDTNNISVYVDRLLDCSTKYKLYKEINTLEKVVVSNSGGEDCQKAEDLISAAESRILTVSMDNKQVEDAVNIGDGLYDFLREKAENPREVLGLSTSIPLIDKAINGLVPGSLTVVSARPKGGKSTFLMNLASHITFSLDVPILYMDTEMSTPEMQTRVVSHLSSVPERFVTNGKFIENQLQTENVWRACAAVEQGGFYHKYMPGFSVDGVKSIARRYHAREGIGALFFDYIKLPEVNGSDSFKEHQILGNIATALKDLAGQLNIPVIAAAQLKRGEAVQPKTKFHDTDVADSDRIGRYCTSLFALGRKSRKEVEEEGLSCGTHRIQILLNRSGSSKFNGIDLEYHFPTLTITQAEHQSDGLPPVEDDF